MRINLSNSFWTLLTGICFGIIFTSSGENYVSYVKDSLKAPKNWFLLDPTEDGFLGTGAAKAHEELLKNKSPKRTVVVAVIDSGIDINHEDLKDKIWTNPGEIAGNGVDDDKNGYIDDVHGWNFIGGADGSHVEEDSHELTREYIRLKAIYQGKAAEDIKRRNREEFAYWQRVSENFEKSKKEAQMNYNMYSNMMDGFSKMAELVKEEFGVTDFKLSDLKKMKSEEEEVKNALETLSQLFSMVNLQDPSVNQILEDLHGAVEHFEVQANYAYNTDFNPRDIVGDDPKDYREKYYGNNDPTGPDPTHGTHVAGIIAAERGNNLGINGIAEHVLILPVRAVPNGDERDKDVANAIRYAVDNGAHIINMSFGKSYSPGKRYVDKAVKYARRKGVLLIHAAGNSSKEVNPDNNFPNRYYEAWGKSDSWLEVGASSAIDTENLPANFSNFSKTGVDLFAPGVDIYSTVPGSEYDTNSGTSMAAPTVAGVAAMIWAYYPDLKPKEMRQVIINSVYKPTTDNVQLPGKDEMVGFDSLSSTGGIVNAYEALKLAASQSKYD